MRTPCRGRSGCCPLPGSSRDLGQLLGEVIRGEEIRAPQSPRCRGIRPGRPADPQVDPAREERLQGSKLLGDHQGRVVGEHDPARAHPHAVGLSGHLTDQHGGRRGGDSLHAVVLGEPVAVVTQRLDVPGEGHRLLQGLSGIRAAPNRYDVQDGERSHEPMNTPAPHRSPRDWSRVLQIALV